MPENVQNCPLCDGRTFQHFATITFRGEKVVNQICKTCGLVFQSPSMTAAELDDFYAREYRQLYQGNEGPNQKDLKTQRGRAESLLAFIRDSISTVDRHLDVGASAGILLQTVQGHYGTQPVGIEPGESYRQHAQMNGLTIYADLDELKNNESRFELVSLGHVLEHFADPVGYLVDLRETVMTPDGWLLIEVPNLYAHDSFETAHMTAFSPHTLRQTLQKAGFEIVKFEAHGRPRSEILPLYLTVLARVGQASGWQLAPEKNVGLKRRWGLLRRKIAQRLFPAKAWKAV